MNRYPVIIVLIAVLAGVILFLGSAQPTTGQDEPKLFKAKDGSGIIGYKDTPILPWCGYHVHDPDRPAPKKVTPAPPDTGGKTGTAPSDAIILFNGTDLSQWNWSDWKIENGELIAVSDELTTKQAFGDCQLHIEWQAPDPPQGEIWDRGNNGVMLMGLFEIQVYDSYTEKLYPDGQAASIYSQTPPMVNACRRPGQWQSYDIIFFAPVFKNGKLEKPAYVTVLHNGVLVHHNQKIYGPTGHRILPRYTEPIPEKLPFSLSAHDNPVRFRNIWLRLL
ncbi:MAG: 3-keto-disaccharide hydrolase [Planctomycetota bacterium]